MAKITTRSGLGAAKACGNIEANYGSFGTGGGNLGLGFGSAKLGNFIAADGVRSGRFLDSPEFRPIHDVGNNETLFDRMDYQPNGKDAFHLNLFAARNWIQNPNSYDQLSQDQRQRVLTWSIAPGPIAKPTAFRSTPRLLLCCAALARRLARCGRRLCSPSARPYGRGPIQRRVFPRPRTRRRGDGRHARPPTR